VYRPPIQRPKVLLVVAHPSVGGAIETIIRLERRYDVRRTGRLSEAAALARSWPAHLALVDELLLGGPTTLGVPALVLAASEADGTAAGRSLDDARGWIPKDASSTELIAAVERLLTRRSDERAGPLAVAAVGILLAILAALLLYLLRLALV
jgi:DNA-binding NarL/FixJ family response regulator